MLSYYIGGAFAIVVAAILDSYIAEVVAVVVPLLGSCGDVPMTTYYCRIPGLIDEYFLVVVVLGVGVTLIVRSWVESSARY